MISNKQKKLKVTRRRVIVLTCLVMVCIAAFFNSCGCMNKQRDTQIEAAAVKKWAQRLELPGVSNFHKVSDVLYRGGPPTAEGMRQLEKLGIKTVVDLRLFGSDTREIKGTGMVYEHIYFQTWHPEKRQIVRFLQIVTDPNLAPVYVHCRRGADRTGFMCAIYRIAVQGWNKEQAIKEMTKGGFGFNRFWQNLINYLNKLDVEEIRQEAGLNEKSP